MFETASTNLVFFNYDEKDDGDRALYTLVMSDSEKQGCDFNQNWLTAIGDKFAALTKDCQSDKVYFYQFSRN